MTRLPLLPLLLAGACSTPEQVPEAPVTFYEGAGDVLLPCLQDFCWGLPLPQSPSNAMEIGGHPGYIEGAENEEKGVAILIRWRRVAPSYETAPSRVTPDLHAVFKQTGWERVRHAMSDEHEISCYRLNLQRAEEHRVHAVLMLTEFLYEGDRHVWLQASPHFSGECEGAGIE